MYNLDRVLPDNNLCSEDVQILRTIVATTISKRYNNSTFRRFYEDISQQAILYAFECSNLDLSLPTARISTYLQNYVTWKLQKYVQKEVFRHLPNKDESQKSIITFSSLSSIDSSESEFFSNTYKELSVEDVDVLEEQEEQYRDSCKLQIISQIFPILSPRSRRIFNEVVYGNKTLRELSIEEHISAARCQCLYRQTVHDIRDMITYLDEGGFYYDVEHNKYRRIRNKSNEWAFKIY